MKRLALLFAIAWWTQGALCVLPFGPAHTHEIAGETAASGADHHAAAPEPAAGGHHSKDDPSCAEHCASLSRALGSHAPQAEPSGTLFVMLLPASAPAPVLPPLAGAAAVARGQPPIDLARANPILRT